MRPSTFIFAFTLISAAMVSACSSGSSSSSSLASRSVAREAPAANAAKSAPAETEEFVPAAVRLEFFEGFQGGDEAKLEHVQKVCERTLARDPHHPEALVWHGFLLLVRSGQSLRRGDRDQGLLLRSRALRELDEGAALKPNGISARAPHGVAMFTLALDLPVPQAREFLEKGVDDYETVLRLHGDRFESLSPHARAELLFGLADGWAKLGDSTRAHSYYARLSREEPKTDLGERSLAWLAGRRDLGPRPSCTSTCHVAGRD